ncbi:hypothetical protein M6D81_31180 [Paenibacillus sp. J5C_2022]|uniref:hypothetical protein n=1 Tax=Paenibacillus sp. J5C2022 TaxID=2977129 RepID=UPI0021D0A293|nr:hypothetical protein [Paenibacillus sp. J5C2022]MCU6713171.1 hypothetical protein [Paenibacillus sp. J5C2022]
MRVIKRIVWTVVILLLLLAGAVWAGLAYIAPERELGFQLENEKIDVKEKALHMVKRMKPELVLTESEVNDLIRLGMERQMGDHIRIEGADFQLAKDRLIGDINVMYRERIPAGVKVEYEVDWKEPNLVLYPAVLSIKAIDLPLHYLETITIPLDLPSGEAFSVEEVRMEEGRLMVLFDIKLPF